MRPKRRRSGSARGRAVESRSAASGPPPLSLWTRLWFAWVCLARVLFYGTFAARVRALDDALPSSAALDARAERAAAAPPASPGPALQLLALFQREGRLIDFLMQDIAPYSDNDVGVVARTVHEGC